MSAVRTRGLELRADGKTLCGPVDLDVEQGENVLLVGASGSGKTTLLRALAGLSAPDAGTIELFGQAASAPGRVLVAPERRRVGFLFQGGALWPHMSVEKTLRFVLRYRGINGTQASQRVTELLERVELGGFEKRTPGNLSGGEKQRLALARALASEPKLLLLDEPLGPLDATLRAGLLERLHVLHGELDWTTIHVTHDPEEARAYASRVLTMEAGRLSE